MAKKHLYFLLGLLKVGLNSQRMLNEMHVIFLKCFSVGKVIQFNFSRFSVTDFILIVIFLRIQSFIYLYLKT